MFWWCAGGAAGAVRCRGNVARHLRRGGVHVFDVTANGVAIDPASGPEKTRGVGSDGRLGARRATCASRAPRARVDERHVGASSSLTTVTQFAIMFICVCDYVYVCM